jgi:hypothetical protein
MNVTVTAFPTHVARVAISLTVAFAVSDRLTGEQRFPIIPVVGTVKGISGSTIYVESGAQVMTIFAVERTRNLEGQDFSRYLTRTAWRRLLRTVQNRCFRQTRGGSNLAQYR